MRTALRCSARLSVASLTVLRSPICTRAVYQTSQNVSSRCSRLASTTVRRRLRAPLKPALRKFKVYDPRDPESYAALYNEFLPADLRTRDGVQAHFNLKKVLAIKAFAEEAREIDLWVWMAQNGYRRQLVWLLNTALNHSVSRKKEEVSVLSNLDWPATIFDELHYSERPPPEIFVDKPENIALDTSLDEINPRTYGRELLDTIWLTLTKLVLASDPGSGVAESSMRTVLLVLATMHNLDLIPKDVYSYKISTLSSTVTRPPILHLFSSRILASLSDATWREHQDEAIAQATRLGHSLKHISENAPGGRFRLKVQPLPTELWLEFILWCCVDSGRVSTAHKIVNMLHHSEEPWFAVRWCSTQTSPLAETLVDWNRVKLRHGGAVGRIEGYSREKPFADVPEKTVSAEVILALIEGFVTRRPRSISFQQVSDLLHFLEPHDLPPSYFDYLQSRLLFDGLYDDIADLKEMQEWPRRFTAVRSLKPIKDVSRAIQTLELDSVLDHSLLQIGIMQQSLDASIGHSAVHTALELFNNIQEQIDHNKFQSITEFVQKETHAYRLEYADSHGQIPYHRLAAFLNLATEARMLGLGEWLLYSDDLDDALIPSTVYANTSLAPSLARYASANGDEALFARILADFDDKFASTGKQPSVRANRALFDAGVEFLDFSNVKRHLAALRIQAARIGLTNYAYLGAVILRIESEGLSGQSVPRWTLHQQAVDLMDRMLSGNYYRSASSETLKQKMQYKQQVSHILRMFASCEGSSLKDLATKHAYTYASGNNVMLYTRVFDVLLAGMVDAYGAARGREIYKAFCGNLGYEKIDFDQFESDVVDVPAVEDEIRKDGETDTSEEFLESYFRKQNDVDEPYFAKQDETAVLGGNRLLQPMLITVPQASTLRIILRSALAQKDEDLAAEIREWAITQFALIGTISTNIIAQEIQRPLTDVDLRKVKFLKYHLDKDNHALSTGDQSFYRARVNALARQTRQKKKEAEQSLWANLVPSFHD